MPRQLPPWSSSWGTASNASTMSERLSRILARADQRLLVAELDGPVVGWVHAVASEYVETGVFVIIGGLVVDRQHRGQGIGRLLMADAETWARGRGCAVVRLSSTLARTGAHRFYERLGYTKIKTQHAFAKSLDPARPDDAKRFVPSVEDQGGDSTR